MPCSFGHAPQQMDALLLFVTVGKTAVHSFEQSLLPHRAERWQGTRFEVIHAESIVHADNDPLFSNECHSYKVSTISLLDPLASRRTAVSLQ